MWFDPLRLLSQESIDSDIDLDRLHRALAAVALGPLGLGCRTRLALLASHATPLTLPRCARTLNQLSYNCIPNAPEKWGPSLGVSSD